MNTEPNIREAGTVELIAGEELKIGQMLQTDDSSGCVVRYQHSEKEPIAVAPHDLKKGDRFSVPFGYKET